MKMVKTFKKHLNIKKIVTKNDEKPAITASFVKPT